MAALASSRQPAQVQQLTPPSSSHGAGGSWEFAVPLDGSVRLPFSSPPFVSPWHMILGQGSPLLALLRLSVTYGSSANSTMAAQNQEFHASTHTKHYETLLTALCRGSPTNGKPSCPAIQCPRTANHTPHKPMASQSPFARQPGSPRANTRMTG